MKQLVDRKKQDVQPAKQCERAESLVQLYYSCAGVRVGHLCGLFYLNPPVSRRHFRWEPASNLEDKEGRSLSGEV